MARGAFTFGVLIGAGAVWLARALSGEEAARPRRPQTPSDLLSAEMQDATLGHQADELDQGVEEEHLSAVEGVYQSEREASLPGRKNVSHNPEAQSLPPIVGEE